MLSSLHRVGVLGIAHMSSVSSIIKTRGSRRVAPRTVPFVLSKIHRSLPRKGRIRARPKPDSHKHMLDSASPTDDVKGG